MRHRWPRHAAIMSWPSKNFSRHELLTDLAVTLACSLILSRLDYGNSSLHGVQFGNVVKLQRVQNIAAYVVLHSRQPDGHPFKPVLQSLHWLPVRQRIGRSDTQQSVHFNSITERSHGTYRNVSYLFGQKYIIWHTPKSPQKK
jgi:hypothetical protein